MGGGGEPREYAIIWETILLNYTREPKSIMHAFFGEIETCMNDAKSSFLFFIELYKTILILSFIIKFVNVIFLPHKIVFTVTVFVRSR